MLSRYHSHSFIDPLFPFQSPPFYGNEPAHWESGSKKEGNEEDAAGVSAHLETSACSVWDAAPKNPTE